MKVRVVEAGTVDARAEDRLRLSSVDVELTLAEIHSGIDAVRVCAL